MMHEYVPLVGKETDYYWLNKARKIAELSPDPSTKCGAVIVRPNGDVVTYGRNVFPIGCDQSPELYANREEKYQRIIHAELDAILTSVVSVRGCYLYTWWPPGLAPSCDRCAAHVIHAGITHVAYYDAGEVCERWENSIRRAFQLYKEAGVVVHHVPLLD
jgi:dCMP deaminase